MLDGEPLFFRLSKRHASSTRETSSTTLKHRIRASSSFNSAKSWRSRGAKFRSGHFSKNLKWAAPMRFRMTRFLVTASRWCRAGLIVFGSRTTAAIRRAQNAVTTLKSTELWCGRRRILAAVNERPYVHARVSGEKSTTRPEPDLDRWTFAKITLRNRAARRRSRGPIKSDCRSAPCRIFGCVGRRVKYKRRFSRRKRKKTFSSFDCDKHRRRYQPKMTAREKAQVEGRS